MLKYLHILIAFFIITQTFAQLPARQSIQHGKRIALVIGNGNYIGSTLANPENDARAMAEILKKLGFDVDEYENLTQVDMKKAIDDFGLKLKDYDVGLFFYAGHGIQAQGYNYLIPVDARIRSEVEVEYECVQADRVLAKMDGSGTDISIIILDACRNNPFERSWTRSSTGRGLAFMNAPRGTLIAYATAPGSTASDGGGNNGLYTSAILESIQIPDINIIQMFQNVRNIVSQKSGNAQIPWESTSLTGDFYFNSTGAIDIEFQKKLKTELTQTARDNGNTGILIDSRDNHQYKIVTIGSQMWMAENLNYDSGGGSWNYENNSASAFVYGRLYNWITAKLICPEGWHLPDYEEWLTLITFLGGDSIAGGKMKEKGTKHWKSPNIGATDEVGFTALPGGWRNSDNGRFRRIWESGNWWSSTDSINHNAMMTTLTFDSKIAILHLSYVETGQSVRCIRDELTK
jgi:uncharacterized protein (TIGR02145 family)